MSSTTTQFFHTSNRLIRDVTLGLGRELKDPNWIGAFCLPMVGSLGHECNGFSTLEEGKPTVMGSLGGISFPQWTGMGEKGRRKAFMALCRRLHLHPYGYDAALAMILYELMGTARSVVNATMQAPTLTVEAATSILGPAGATCDRALLGRVVKFEKLYEGAGVKHYPSRYAYAIAARDAYTSWARLGFPEPAQFVMPKSRFSAQFDKEFGPGTSATTRRWDSAPPATMARPAGTIATAEDMGAVLQGASAALPIAPREVQLQPGVKMTFPMGKAVAGSWPEDGLSSAEIKAVQARLRAMGYVRVGQIDGRWGANTRASVAAMQAENGLAVDGHYGPATRAALAAGKPHKVAPERATASAKMLLAAGEPTLAAVHPVSIGAKILAGVSAAGTVVGYIADAWPQASAALDGLKNTFANLPGWVWPLATLAVALYFVLIAGRVKAVAVDNFRTGANTALAVPLAPDGDDQGAVLPPVPGEVVSVPFLTAGPLIDAAQDALFDRDVHERDTDAVSSEPDRPLGVDDGTADYVAATRDLSGVTWADLQRGEAKA